MAIFAPPNAERTPLFVLAQLFLKLGTIGVGGPAAHIAMMEDEVVRRRRWLTREQFLDYLGATNLIPGPNSTEMAIHIGYGRRSWPGLLVAGVCFILPAALIVVVIAWAYVRFGTVPAATGLLSGVKPVVIAVVVQALWGLGRSAVQTPGPLFTTATFVGYVLAGTAGAVVATVGIFLPAFVFVAASGSLVPRLRRSPTAGAVLDGVNVASLALMAVVTWHLGRAALVDWETAALGLGSALLLLRYRVNSAWLVALGALAGVLIKAYTLAPRIARILERTPQGAQGAGRVRRGVRRGCPCVRGSGRTEAGALRRVRRNGEAGKVRRPRPRGARGPGLLPRHARRAGIRCDREAPRGRDGISSDGRIRQPASFRAVSGRSGDARGGPVHDGRAAGPERGGDGAARR